MHKSSSRRASCGVSLVELLIAISIAAIVLGLGAPAMGSLIDDYRRSSFTNELLGALSLARSEAIKRGQRVTLCPSRDGVSCTPATDWDAGWIAFADLNANAVRDAVEPLIQAGRSAPGSVSAWGNGSMSGYVSYVPLGTTRAVSGAFQSGSIRVCAGGRERVLVVSRGGRVRVDQAEPCTQRS